MAEITRTRGGQLVRKVFEILLRHPEGLRAREVLAQLERELPPTEFERSFYETQPNVRRFEKIVRFHTIAPVKAGWMTKDRGSWTITELGREAYADHQDPAEFMREAVKLYYQWKRGQPESEDEAEAEAEAASPSTTLEEAEEAAWSEIEGYLAKLNPYDFQDLVAGLLRGMEYHVSWVAPAGPDRGVDIIAHTDPLGIDRGRIKVQVKRRADKIPVGEVRHQERRRIMLLDAKRLFDLWVQHYESIPEPQRRLLPLRPVHFLALSE
jgi:restriction system protein